MKTFKRLFLPFVLDKKILFIGCCFLCWSVQTFAQPGRLDFNFQNVLQRGSDVMAIEIQADGKFLLAGNTAARDGFTRESIIRFNANGVVDTTFISSETLSNGDRYKIIKLQSDGKIIYTTEFGKFFRLNADGSRDTTFSLSDFNVSAVRDLDVQADGKILVSGYNLIGTYFVTRFNADGSHDTNFNTTYGSGRVAFAPLENKIYISKRFSNGVSHINRFNLNGSVDAGFATVTVASDQFEPIVDFETHTNGRILLWGEFIAVNGATRHNFALVNSNGSLDASFNPATSGAENVSSVAVQTNGKIIVGGSNFTFNTFLRGNVARLNADGTLDATFNQGRGANGEVRALRIRGSDRLLIGGNFFRYHIFPRNGLVQIDL